MTMTAPWPFDGLKHNHYGAILADPPWGFQCRDGKAERVPSRAKRMPYDVMSMEDLAALTVADLAAPDCGLLCWVVWPTLPEAIDLISQWGFAYKTCGFAWTKADVSSLNLFDAPIDAAVGMGYWTRSNSEVALLVTGGSPKRLDAGVRQGIIEPCREHPRKPECIHGRIERLVAGPYVELFARQRVAGWDSMGEPNEEIRFISEES